MAVLGRFDSICHLPHERPMFRCVSFNAGIGDLRKNSLFGLEVVLKEADEMRQHCIDCQQVPPRGWRCAVRLSNQ